MPSARHSPRSPESIILACFEEQLWPTSSFVYDIHVTVEGQSGNHHEIARREFRRRSEGIERDREAVTCERESEKARQSEAIRGNQRQSEAIRGIQRRSGPIRSNLTCEPESEEARRTHSEPECEEEATGKPESEVAIDVSDVAIVM